MAEHSHSDYADGFDDGKAQAARTASAALALLDVAGRLRDVGDIKARDLERQARELLRDAGTATEQISLPLADAQMLLDWMHQTFGNDDGVDWHDEDAAAVADALHKAVDDFKAMRSAVARGVKASGSNTAPPPVADGGQKG